MEKYEIIAKEIDLMLSEIEDMHISDITFEAEECFEPINIPL